ncbi:MAG: DUF120 domain-containing protein [Methanomicrobiales archaeon]
MKIKGIIVSGSKEGAYFMSQEVYKDQFSNKLGFKPYEGTLNIKISDEELSKIQHIPKENYDTIKGSGNLGDVKFLMANLNNKIEGAVIFPIKTHHSSDLLEFVAPYHLRNKLNLKDGDIVYINLEN